MKHEIELEARPESDLLPEERALLGKLYTAWGKTYRLAGFRAKDGPWMVDISGEELPRTVSIRAIGSTFREARR
jgi:hypothetical protein